VDSNHRSPSRDCRRSERSRRDHRAKYGCLSARPRVRCLCPPGKTQHLLPRSVFDRPGFDRWNLASTTFPDAGPMVRIRFPPAVSRRRTQHDWLIAHRRAIPKFESFFSSGLRVSDGIATVDMGSGYTRIVRFWCARPRIAVSLRWPAMTRTPSSSLPAMFSGAAVSRNATRCLRQAAKTRSRASRISGG
jgi:hypothetical protein